MFALNGRPQNVEFKVINDGHNITGEVAFSLNGRKIQLGISDTSCPITESSEIIVVVKRGKKGELCPIAWQIKTMGPVLNNPFPIRVFAVLFIFSGLSYLFNLFFISPIEYFSPAQEILAVFGLFLIAGGVHLIFAYREFLKAKAVIRRRLIRLEKIDGLRYVSKEHEPLSYLNRSTGLESQA
jgi:hypothetical protein